MLPITPYSRELRRRILDIEAIEEAGAEVVPLPPYSPDYTPIEEMFSKAKGAMRSATGRTKEAV